MNEDSIGYEEFKKALDTLQIVSRLTYADIRRQEGGHRGDANTTITHSAPYSKYIKSSKEQYAT